MARTMESPSPRPEPPASRVRGHVEAAEALEDALPIVVGDAGVVVVDDDRGAGDRDGHGAGGVPGGVVEQVGDRPDERRPRSVDPAAIDDRHGHRHQALPCRLLPYQRGEIDLVVGDHAGLLDTGKEQQIGQERLEPAFLDEGGGHALAERVGMMATQSA